MSNLAGILPLLSSSNHPSLTRGVSVLSERSPLRYLVALFAKDLTLSSTSSVHDSVLEQMVDVISLAERNLLKTR